MSDGEGTNIERELRNDWSKSPGGFDHLLREDQVDRCFLAGQSRRSIMKLLAELDPGARHQDREKSFPAGPDQNRQGGLLGYFQPPTRRGSSRPAARL